MEEPQYTIPNMKQCSVNTTIVFHYRYFPNSWLEYYDQFLQDPTIHAQTTLVLVFKTLYKNMALKEVK